MKSECCEVLNVGHQASTRKTSTMSTTMRKAMMPSCPRDPALFSTYSIFFCGAGSGQVVQVVQVVRGRGGWVGWGGVGGRRMEV